MIERDMPSAASGTSTSTALQPASVARLGPEAGGSVTMTGATRRQRHIHHHPQDRLAPDRLQKLVAAPHPRGGAGGQDQDVDDRVHGRMVRLTGNPVKRSVSRASVPVVIPQGRKVDAGRAAFAQDLDLGPARPAPGRPA
jgi:hypothetical protein